MSRITIADRITLDPDLLSGKPTVRGLRISVEQILRALGSGVSEAELLKEYPELEPEDFRAIQDYAAERLASERIYPIAAASTSTRR
jgi:uncharacterized protein (DUF433 family)